MYKDEEEEREKDDEEKERLMFKLCEMLKCKEYLSNKKKKKTVKARLLCNS
jgi:hypothetical protein